MYTLILVPINIGFQTQSALWSTWFIIDLVVDLSFVFDLILNFFAYYEHPRTKVVIANRSKIQKRYLKSWFGLDVLAILPFGAILPSILLSRHRQGMCLSPRTKNALCLLLTSVPCVRAFSNKCPADYVSRVVHVDSENARSGRLLRFTKFARFTRMLKLGMPTLPSVVHVACIRLS